MMAAFVALPDCELLQIGGLLRELVRQEWSVRTLTLGGDPVPTDCGIQILADADLYTAFPRDFRVLLVAGGDISGAMNDPSLLRFLRQYDASGGVIASIGSATAVMANAGLLGGLHITVDKSCRELYAQDFVHTIVDDEDVVFHGGVVTARSGAVTAFQEEVFRVLRTYVR